MGRRFYRTLPTIAQVEITFPQGIFAAENDVRGEVLLNRAQMEYRKKQEILSIVETRPQDALSSLLTLSLEASLLSVPCEILRHLFQTQREWDWM